MPNKEKPIMLNIFYTDEKIPYGLGVITQTAWENNYYANMQWEQEQRYVTKDTTVEALVDALYKSGVLSDNKKYLRKSRIYFASKTRTKPRLLRLQDDEDGRPGEDRGKTLGELGLTSNSFLVVYAPQAPPTPVHNYYNPGNITCLYGCPVTDREGNPICQFSEETEAQIYEAGLSRVFDEPL